jgi:NADPH2:quinone reductase
MKQTIQKTMHVVAIDRFGGIETLTPRTLPIPEAGPHEVLIHVEAAGVGVWDPFEREGGFSKVFGIEARFPYVLGSDGAGTIVEVGSLVHRFAEGDRVYGYGLGNPKGGFYAEYIALNEEKVSPMR